MVLWNQRDTNVDCLDQRKLEKDAKDTGKINVNALDDFLNLAFLLLRSILKYAKSPFSKNDTCMHGHGDGAVMLNFGAAALAISKRHQCIVGHQQLLIQRLH